MPHVSVSPSFMMTSSSVTGPIRAPFRVLLDRYGALLMLSIPPATTTDACPSMMVCAPSITDLSPRQMALAAVRAPLPHPY